MLTSGFIPTSAPLPHRTHSRSLTTVRRRKRVSRWVPSSRASYGNNEGDENVASPEKWDLSLKSPSKINLFLRILGRRKDGYHELASLFQAISLHDNLNVSALPGNATEDVLECSTPGVPTDGTNLVLRAFDIYRKHTGATTRFRAQLDKRIPHAAGLGGGSGNAATALWAANKLTKGKLTDTELAGLGAEFGSDISFFFTNGTAYCTGRGDKMMQVERLNTHTLYIVKPKESLSTRDVFRALDVEGCKNGANPRDLLEAMKKGVLFADFVNDLEKPAFELLPRMSEIKEALYDAGLTVVMMTGSGTAFFCFGHPNDRDGFFEVFPDQWNVKIFPCMFASRRFPDLWYFEQPPASELQETTYANKFFI